jgi:hypothetical protein
MTTGAPVEPRPTVDHPKNLDHATHPPKITQLGSQHRKNLRAIQPGRRPSRRSHAGSMRWAKPVLTCR